MKEQFDIKDIFIVAARLKRIEKEYLGSSAFDSLFATLLDLIEKLETQNEAKN